jgi:steroid delta-isomerase-like uncharacterized protein
MLGLFDRSTEEGPFMSAERRFLSTLDEDDAYSRRSVLHRVGAGGLIAVLAASGLRVASAQEAATPGLATPLPALAALPTFMKRWMEAYNAHDANAVAALYTEQGTYEDVPSGTRATGRHDIATFLAELFAATEELRIGLTSGVRAGGLGAAEHTDEAIDRGIFKMIGIPATGKRFSVRTVTIFEMDGDLIYRSSDYYDRATVMQQLGLLAPVVVEAGTPVATPGS